MAEKMVIETTQNKVMSSGSATIVSTNIDRRKCRRIVPMKVLVLGQSRTGTCSIRQALLDLGYSDVYHFSSMLQNPRDVAMWKEAFDGKFEGGKPFTKEDWDQLLGHCMAVTDTPSVVFAEELVAAYPDAKVILTVRDSTDAWHKSYMSTIYPFFDFMYIRPTLWTSLIKWLRPQAQWKYWDYIQPALIKYMGITEWPTKGKEFYERRNEEIKALVPKEKLLVFNVKEGWEPLCRYLGKGVPNGPFPHLNETEQMNQVCDSMWRSSKVGAAVNVTKAVVWVGVTYGVWRYYSRARL